MNFYNIYRNVGTPIFKEVYHPTIINNENIPEKGPIIFCGNHLHVWDQVPVVISTKNNIHWMAKKEYFDSKLGFFYKSAGCISVDRFNNPHESKEQAIEILKNNECIGIFPEGTRNNVKDDVLLEIYNKYFLKDVAFDNFKKTFLAQKPLLSYFNLLNSLYETGKIDVNEFKQNLFKMNDYIELLVARKVIDKQQALEANLLPFHYGAVSMAKKTNAQIVPFAVNGDYNSHNNNLVVSFDNPYFIESDDLELENEKLKNKVLTLINRNKKNSKK